jgi:predicted Rossmann fold flavoprotein
LMAAGRAAATGAETVLLERKSQPGRKLSITGKGRCNLTNIIALDEFMTHFGRNGRFLRQAFTEFFSSDLIAFLNKLGIATITERGGRVFPVSGDAGEVVEALIRWNLEQGVQLKTNSRVRELIIDSGKITGVKAESRFSRKNKIETISADTVIVATGGKSYPRTGSTGDGYRLAQSAGHSIIPLRPALVPLETEGDTASRLQGLNLRNVRIKLIADDRKKAEELGEMDFTDFGICGPVILTLSGRAVDLLRDGRKVEISTDLKPGLDDLKLDARLRRDFAEYGKRRFRNVLRELLPRKMIDICIESTGIPEDLACNQISSVQRKKLRLWLKDFRLQVTGHRPIDEAIITAGGVNLKEIDPRTMQSRIVKGLYFAGEILDIDADTGGYNLQAAFSTGWLAGSGR